LKEAVSTAARMAILWNPDNAINKLVRRLAKRSASHRFPSKSESSKILIARSML